MATLTPEQQDVIEERDALNKRIAALDATIRHEDFAKRDHDEAKQMKAQLLQMRRYATTLLERIVRFAG